MARLITGRHASPAENAAWVRKRTRLALEEFSSLSRGQPNQKPPGQGASFEIYRGRMGRDGGER